MSTRFVILGSQRTGTTFIRTSLASHPAILCHGEVFNLGKRPYKDQGGYWHYCRTSVSNRIRSIVQPAQGVRRYLTDLYSNGSYSAIGFKLMLNHCRLRPYIWPVVSEFGVKAILVHRRNALKTLVSRRAAADSGVYHVSDSFRRKTAVSSWTPRKIDLAPENLLSELNSIVAEQDEWKSMLANVRHLTVVYEDYTADVGTGNRSILDFLEVPLMSISSDLQKVNPDRLSDIIANYDDVVSALEGTEFSRFLQ